MSVIVFATGGTTGKSRTVEHPWENYQFVTSTAAKVLSPLFRDLSVSSVANCLGAAGNLWGGFLFAHEICRLLQVEYYPFASIVDKDALCEAIDTFSIDTIICLPSFLNRLLCSENKSQLSSLKKFRH
ncbi:long-chain fatty acid--CoA ligase [Mechercharimyces sp. CAU 1602]|uniref:long-chain fatty acid--CoA ligase n=1 Tax=Mechercharimyces sp. CAU 1602 TaxID=2973933 RepID=UPI00216388A7|nr:long-chain fatty acid--CoA ligase [Mechercharimyces sp. CAU 1602]MCS1352610.1 long-chain fatty acid--CoA ligase [Mechercharimyces sp. CAU 1602]